MTDMTVVNNQSANPYAAAGSMYAGPQGVRLKFAKGEYLAGKDGEVVTLGTRLVANMPGAKHGWLRWGEGGVEEDRMSLVSEGRRIENRNELGDDDQRMWRVGADGKPMDPWTQTVSFDALDPKTGTLYSFTSSSAGGRKAFGALLNKFGAEYRMRPGMLPIIELQKSSYNHPNKQFGRIQNPEFPLVGWADENDPSKDCDEPQLTLNGASNGPTQGQRAANPTLVAVPTTATEPSSTTTISPSSATDVGRTRF